MMDIRQPAAADPESIRKLILSCELLLRDAWNLRVYDTDIIVLSDARIGPREHECMVTGVGPNPLVVYIEPRMKVAAMLKSVNMAKVRDAYEIRCIPSGPQDDGRLTIPVLVTLLEGSTVTSWRPPGPSTEGIDPFVDPMAN